MGSLKPHALCWALLVAAFLFYWARLPVAQGQGLLMDNTIKKSHRVSGGSGETDSGPREAPKFAALRFNSDIDPSGPCQEDLKTHCAHLLKVVGCHLFPSFCLPKSFSVLVCNPYCISSSIRLFHTLTAPTNPPDDQSCSSRTFCPGLRRALKNGLVHFFCSADPF